jgi:membrane-associated phospholipid phosphatase
MIGAMRALGSFVLSLVLAASVSSSARADVGGGVAGGGDEEAWTDHDRLVHAGVIGGLGITYLVLEFSPLIDQWSPKQCKWCAPTGVDRSVRDALKWQDTSLANLLSAGTGYVSAPLAGTGLLVLATWERGDWRRWADDVSPVVEAAIATSLLQHGTKLIVGRERPYAWAAAPGALPATKEDNVSFWSGHTSLDFSIAVAAGTIASRRGYRLAPVIWATGLSLAAVTGYLRIAADKHWTIDVLTGAAMGSVVGYVWPRLFHGGMKRDGGVTLVPTSNGLAVSGAF